MSTVEGTAYVCQMILYSLPENKGVFVMSYNIINNRFGLIYYSSTTIMVLKVEYTGKNIFVDR